MGRVVLALLHVGLIERLNAENVAGDGGGELPAKKLPAQIVAVAHVEAQDRVACGLKPGRGLIQRAVTVTRNVACLVAAPKPENARDRVLEPDEWSRLYDAAPGWFKPVLLTGYHTGMRLEEILTLTWDRVDLERGRIFLPAALTKTKQDRSVPMTPTLRREYQLLRQQDGIVRISGLVFQKNGKKFNHTYRTMRKICQAQQIENFIFHDLRHCAVTNLADAGVDTETIMKIVGHSSVEMFLRYRTIKAEKLDDAMSRLNTLITRRSPASSQALEIATV